MQKQFTCKKADNVYCIVVKHTDRLFYSRCTKDNNFVSTWVEFKRHSNVFDKQDSKSYVAQFLPLISDFTTEWYLVSVSGVALHGNALFYSFYWNKH